MKRPGIASTCWFIAFVAVSILLIRQSRWVPSDERPPDIVFAVKVFYDSAQTTGDGIVSITGTLVGEGLGYKNNAVLIACYKDSRECLTYSVEQIGPNQIGRLSIPMPYSVVKWAADEIVATGSGDAVDCRKVTITIVRKTETAVWVEEPINLNRAVCKEVELKPYKWTIEDPPFWKSLRK